MGEPTTIQSRAIRKAAEILGGDEQLATRLGLAAGTVRLLRLGRVAVPQHLFLRVVDIISGAVPIEKPRTEDGPDRRRDGDS